MDYSWDRDSGATNPFIRNGNLVAPDFKNTTFKLRSVFKEGQDLTRGHIMDDDAEKLQNPGMLTKFAYTILNLRSKHGLT